MEGTHDVLGGKEQGSNNHHTGRHLNIPLKGEEKEGRGAGKESPGNAGRGSGNRKGRGQSGSKKFSGRGSNKTAASSTTGNWRSFHSDQKGIDSRPNGPSGGRQFQKNKNGGRGKHGGNKSGGSQNSSRLRFETSNFQSNFHEKLCLAARYKVHAPICSCSKMNTLRQRYEEHQKHQMEKKEVVNDQPAASKIDSNEEEVSKQLSELQIGTKDLTTSEEQDPFDSLLVVPDTRSTPAIFRCIGTNSTNFRENAIACERKLAHEIFGSADPAAAEDSGRKTPFKVSCAQCLLKDPQRNGFVAVVSHALEEVQKTVDESRNAEREKIQNKGKIGLHADHAHFVCALDLETLQLLLKSGKTRSRCQKLSMEILTQMKERGVDVPSEIFSSSCNDDNNVSGSAVDNNAPSIPVKVNMGHHLTSMLWLLDSQTTSSKRTSPQKTTDATKTSIPNYSKANGKSSSRINHLMVLGYKDGPYEWTLDLPGGKRHLGESMIDGVIREVEEECSLQLDKKWMEDNTPRLYGGRTICENEDYPSDANRGNGFLEVLKEKGMARETGNAYILMTLPSL